jgi:hypothetical protein
LKSHDTFFGGKNIQGLMAKTVQSATGEKRTGIILSNSERKREKKEDRSTVLLLSGLVLHSG